MCKIYYFVWNMCYTASITILTAIAIERYIAITYPLKARRCITRARLVVAQALIWIISFLYNIPYLIIFDLYSYTYDTYYCFYNFTTVDMRALTTVNFVVWYVVPLFVMILIYVRIGIVLWRTGSSKPFQERRNQEPQDESYCTSSSSNASERHRQIRMHEYGKKKKVSFEKPGNRKRNQDQEDNTPDICLCVEKNSCEYTNSRHGGPRSQDMDMKDGRHIRKRDDINHYQTRSPNEAYSFSLRFRFYFNNNQAARVRTSKAVRNRRKVIRLLVAVVVSFALFVLPHHIRLLLKHWKLLPSSNVTILSPISFLILYLNSALNPILYALFSANFRKSFKEVLPCKKRRRQPSFVVQDHQHTKSGTF